MNQPPIIPGAKTFESGLKKCIQCGTKFYGNACPSCGGHGVKHGRFSWGVGAFLLIGLLFVAYSFSSLPKPVGQLKVKPIRTEPAFLPASGRINEGTKLFMADTHDYVGEVVTTEMDHAFPDGTQRDGVLIKFLDGKPLWVPRDAVKKLYVVKNGH